MKKLIQTALQAPSPLFMLAWVRRGRGWGATAAGRLTAIPLARHFGGYIEDAQLAMLGKEVYEELHGPTLTIPKDFVVPADDTQWPSNLWDHPLGASVRKHGLIEAEKEKR